jgi:predicted transposase YbfD/YdcC
MGTSILEHFSVLEDPRIERGKEHQLLDIVVLAICAVVSGAEGWEAIELFGRTRLAWLRRYVPLAKGVPAHDTLARVLSRISARGFETCFASWVRACADITDGEVVAIDGKTLRRSHDRRTRTSALHLVSAWATSNRLVLGQRKTAAHSNEIEAIPKLLEVLELKGCIVTIDAMGCQTEIASQIVAQKADYVLAVKGNQEELYEDVQEFFSTARSAQFRGVKHTYHETVDSGHGRIEVRRYWLSPILSGLGRPERWAKLKAIGLVESERHVGDRVSVEQRYYICSFDRGAAVFADAVRRHWGIENSLHWVLDMTFREDESRIRRGEAPQNFAVLRRMALNLLKRETTLQKSVKQRRMKAGWDEDYLSKVLFN